MGEATAYRRDASWNATGAASGSAGKMHLPHPDDFALSACGRVALDNRPRDRQGEPAASVESRRRCKAPGCRELWP